MGNHLNVSSKIKPNLKLWFLQNNISHFPKYYTLETRTL